jgi:hypothetical protein
MNQSKSAEQAASQHLPLFGATRMQPTLGNENFIGPWAIYWLCVATGSGWLLEKPHGRFVTTPGAYTSLYRLKATNCRE